LWFYSGKDAGESVLGLDKCDAEACDNYASMYNKASEDWLILYM